jgi:hypothetical protein
LQQTFFKTSVSSVDRTIVGNEEAWKNLLKTISADIADANLTDEAKRMLVKKTQSLNFASQSVITERFFGALGLDIGALERAVWANRNRAAHGGNADSSNDSRLIRKNKVPLIMMNRILLALGGGGDL